MRIEAAVTSISWIPSEAVTGLTKAGFTSGVMHYDDTPPDHVENLAELHKADRFRFANQLAAWVEVENGQVVDAGYAGRGYVSSTRVSFGARGGVTFQPTEFPELRTEPELRGDQAVFSQTVGGRTGVPFPRPVQGKPFFQWVAPTVWTTLRLTIGADGTSAGELASASPFPRHWIYDDGGALVQKAGTIDFKTWYRESHGERTPWGEEDSPAVVTAAESELERRLSAEIMRGGAAPERRQVEPGKTLVEQGDPGDELYLLLDGVLAVEVDGEEVAEVGPGALVGERALLEGGTRKATLRATTRSRVAVVPGDAVDRDALEELAQDRR